jgi:hypothetical protein
VPYEDAYSLYKFKHLYFCYDYTHRENGVDVWVKDIFTSEYNSIVSVNIKNLHELQNLTFALTKQELIFKP